jgi:hypothetical protein
MAKKKDYSSKEPGQQFEEIESARRQYLRRQRRQKGDYIGGAGEPKPIIDYMEKSKQRDKEELKQLAKMALKKIRKRRTNRDDL